MLAVSDDVHAACLPRSQAKRGVRYASVALARLEMDPVPAAGKGGGLEASVGVGQSAPEEPVLPDLDRESAQRRAIRSRDPSKDLAGRLDGTAVASSLVIAKCGTSSTTKSSPWSGR